MPLRLVTATNAVDLWLRDRQQRDQLLEAAYARGCPGWLGTPLSFWTALPSRFDIRVRPIGLLTRRARITELSSLKPRRRTSGTPHSHHPSS